MAKHRPDVLLVYWDVNTSKIRVELHEVLSDGNSADLVKANMDLMMNQIAAKNAGWATTVKQTYDMPAGSSLLVGTGFEELLQNGTRNSHWHLNGAGTSQELPTMASADGERSDLLDLKREVLA